MHLTCKHTIPALDAYIWLLNINFFSQPSDFNLQLFGFEEYWFFI